jgi:hypothetical protein
LFGAEDPIGKEVAAKGLRNKLVRQLAAMGRTF